MLKVTVFATVDELHQSNPISHFLREGVRPKEEVLFVFPYQIQ